MFGNAQTESLTTQKKLRRAFKTVKQKKLVPQKIMTVTVIIYDILQEVIFKWLLKDFPRSLAMRSNA